MRFDCAWASEESILDAIQNLTPLSDEERMKRSTHLSGMDGWRIWAPVNRPGAEYERTAEKVWFVARDAIGVETLNPDGYLSGDTGFRLFMAQFITERIEENGVIYANIDWSKVEADPHFAMNKKGHLVSERQRNETAVKEIETGAARRANLAATLLRRHRVVCGHLMKLNAPGSISTEELEDVIICASDLGIALPTEDSFLMKFREQLIPPDTQKRDIREVFSQTFAAAVKMQRVG